MYHPFPFDNLTHVIPSYNIHAYVKFSKKNFVPDDQNGTMVVTNTLITFPMFACVVPVPVVFPFPFPDSGFRIPIFFHMPETT